MNAGSGLLVTGPEIVAAARFPTRAQLRATQICPSASSPSLKTWRRVSYFENQAQSAVDGATDRTIRS